MNNLKLSIIVPVYNVEKYIEKCISSLLVKDLHGYEIIVVNDGTKDRSIEIVRERFEDSRISIIEQNNAGLSAARNSGIAKSKGEYIWCVDSDDWIETDEISKMIALLDGQIDALYFGSYYCDYEVTGETVLSILDNMASTGRELASTSFAHCAPYYIMRKGMLDENNLRFTEGILHEDSLFTPIMITHCGKVRHYVNPVYHHYQRAGSITHTVSPKRIYDMMYVVKTLIEYGEELSQDIRWKWGCCIAQIANGLFLCSKDCKDKKAKAELKNFVNHNSALIDYFAHSGRNNRIMSQLATLMGGRLYQAYSILYKLRYWLVYRYASRVIGLCLLLLFLCSEGVVKGQSHQDCIQTEIGSLDCIKVQASKNVKPVGKAFVIKIVDQKDFDGLNNRITNAIQAGMTNIRVKIGNGLFRFRENHLLRRYEQYPYVSITIEGKRGTLLTSDEGIVRELTKLQDAWQEMIYADSLIEVVDEDKKLCRIPFQNHMTTEERISLLKVQLTEWFRAPVYNVAKIDNQGIYFEASDLQFISRFRRKGYNVNYDWIYREKTPRYRFYDIDKERWCNAARWLCIEHCNYKQIALKNLHFMSNKTGNSLVEFIDTKAENVSIVGCSFDYIRGTILNASATENITFGENTVRNTSGDELRFLNNCQNLRVIKNLFENCGTRISNTFCVNCREATYYIANNTFRDFGYGAIGVGVWHGFEKKHYSGGIVEHNEIFFTPKYFAESWKHMLMDSGAIYIWTQNDNVIIRYNYIHDYIGAGDNRGVFCDDGANNLKIYGNVILNTPNSYSIDSRKVKDQKEGFKNNSNNFMANNVVDNHVRFMGYDDENRHVVKGSNIVLRKGGEESIENKFGNLEIEIKDEIVSEYWVKEGKLMLPNEFKRYVKNAGIR